MRWTLLFLFFLLAFPSQALSHTTRSEQIEDAFERLQRRYRSAEAAVALVELEADLEVADVNERLAEILPGLTANRRALPWLRGRAALLLGTRTGLADDPSSWRERAGLVTDWAVIGPFDNYGYASVDEALPPETQDCLEGCEGGNGTTTWVDVPGLAEDGTAEIHLLYPDTEQRVFYARTHIAVERATTLALQFGADDGAVVWVDDVEVARSTGRHMHGFDQGSGGVRLEPGNHRILVKVLNDGRRCRLSLRLTELDGAPLRQLPTMLGGGVPEAPLAAATLAPAFSLAAALEEAERERDLGVWTLLAPLGERQERPALEPLQRAAAGSPDDAELLWWLARASAGDSAELKTALATVLAANPLHARALRALANAYEREGRDEQARSLLWRADASDPDDPDLQLELANRTAQNLGPSSAITELQQALAQHPHHQGLMRRTRSVTMELDPTPVYDRLLEALETSLSPLSIRRALVNAALDVSREGEALERATELRLERAWDHRTHAAERKVLVQLGRLAEALEQLDTQIGQFPPRGDLLEERGRLLLRLGREEAAQEAWAQALELEPDRQALAQRLEHRRGTDDLYQVAYAVSEGELREFAGRPAIDPDFPTEVLAEIQVTELLPGGGYVRFIQRAFSIRDERAAAALTQMALPFDAETERARLVEFAVLRGEEQRLGARGVETESFTRRSSGMFQDVSRLKVELPQLQPGDTVTYSYRIDSRGGTQRFSDFFGEVVDFDSSFPTRLRRFVLLSPEETPMHWNDIEVDLQEERTLEGRTERTWEVRDQEAIVAEPGGPGGYETGRVLSISNFATWEQVASWWAELSEPQWHLGAEGEALARELAAAHEDTAGQVRAIYEWVITNTHYNGLEFGIHGWKPYQARRVFERGYGDCKDKALLLASMLHTVGIMAEPVILATTRPGIPPQDPPNLRVFNHAITYVPELDWWLDPTAELNQVESLRWDDQGALALRVRRDGTGTIGFIPVDEPADNRVTSEVELVVDTAGDARFTEAWVERGIGVPWLRRLLAEPSTRKDELEANYQGRLRGVRIDELTATGIETLGPEVEVRLSAAVPDFASMEGDRLLVPVTPFRDTFASEYAQLSSRRTELVFRVPRTQSLTVRVPIPDGMVLLEKPDPVETTSSGLVYRFRVDEEDGAAVVREEVTFPVQRVAAEDYPAFRESCLAADAAQAGRLVFGPADNNEEQP